ncbi:hypothetical protein, partial [Gemmatimonas sp.]|uniref:hypothetical protein n=1 Tax=Gemmatimonas sp. TaxID=1962908 RepID=UPI003F6F7BCE
VAQERTKVRHDVLAERVRYQFVAQELIKKSGMISTTASLGERWCRYEDRDASHGGFYLRQ